MNSPAHCHPDEEWRQIAGFEGMYDVSSCGRVRSFRSHAQWKPGRILVGNISEGRQQIVLGQDGRQRHIRFTHQLVLEAFVGPCPTDHVACHWDDDRSNNHLTNLRWDTRSANEQDKKRNGNQYQLNRTHCPQGHPLLPPNLRPARIKQGGRGCLACSRAHAMVLAHPERRDAFAQIADECYRKVVQEGRVVPVRGRPHEGMTVTFQKKWVIVSGSFGHPRHLALSQSAWSCLLERTRAGEFDLPD